MKALEPYLVFPRLEQGNAEIVALLKEHDPWRIAVEYLKECLEFTVEQLGKTENERDKDMVLKGAKGTLEHIINLPLIAKEVIEAQLEEEEMPALDERTPKKEEVANET